MLEGDIEVPSMAMTVEEVAGMDGIGISKNTLYDPLIAQELMPYMRFGRTLRIPRRAFTLWLDFMAHHHVDVCDAIAVRSAVDSDDYRDWMRESA